MLAPLAITTVFLLYGSYIYGRGSGSNSVPYKTGGYGYGPMNYKFAGYKTCKENLYIGGMRHHALILAESNLNFNITLQYDGLDNYMNISWYNNGIYLQEFDDNIATAFTVRPMVLAKNINDWLNLVYDPNYYNDNIGGGQGFSGCCYYGSSSTPFSGSNFFNIIKTYTYGSQYLPAYNGIYNSSVINIPNIINGMDKNLLTGIIPIVIVGNWSYTISQTNGEPFNMFYQIDGKTMTLCDAGLFASQTPFDC